MIYHLSHEFDGWWFQNTDIFNDARSLKVTLDTIQKEVERSKEVFIITHKKKYKEDKRLPPCWKTLELTSFGSLSKLYGNLKPSVKSKDIIATEFDTANHTYLPSWLQSIAQIRNICAHHGRLWNKNLPGRPKLLSKPPETWILDVSKKHEHHMLYIHLCCMKYLLNSIDSDYPFSEKIQALLSKYSNVDEKALGFKEDWRNDKFWIY